jgi:hypothetical protein
MLMLALVKGRGRQFFVLFVATTAALACALVCAMASERFDSIGGYFYSGLIIQSRSASLHKSFEAPRPGAHLEWQCPLLFWKYSSAL